MRLHVSSSISLVALAALALSFGTRALAQSTASPTAGNGTYISTDPLANIRYDNRFDISLGMAYGHIKAGPQILEGANLGGLDLSGSYWFSKRWAVEASGRGYLGTSGVGTVNSSGVKGPFVRQFVFAGGPEWLGPHNKHGALIAHALVGGARFDSHDYPLSPAGVGFYNNQFALAAVLGGHIDLNRSAHWVFRITPDAMFTRYGFDFATTPKTTSPHNNWNFGLSVGAEYRFNGKRK